MIRIIPFHVEHLSYWRTDNREEDILFVTTVMETKDHDTAWSAFIHETLIAVGGVDTLWVYPDGSKCSELWLNVNRQLLRTETIRTITGMRLVRMYKNIISKMDISRLQVVIDENNHCSKKLLSLLGGFEYEGTMRNYPPYKSVANLYAKVQ